jgi:hypothetical protein
VENTDKNNRKVPGPTTSILAGMVARHQKRQADVNQINDKRDIQQKCVRVCSVQPASTLPSQYLYGYKKI